MINPNLIINQVMNNPNIANNPIAKNAIELYKKGDMQGLNNLAQNLCNERGIKPEEAYEKIKTMFN